MADFLEKQSALQKVNLNFSQYLTKLHFINIDFSSCPWLTEKGLSALAESLKKQRCLESLTLLFERYSLMKFLEYLMILKAALT